MLLTASANRNIVTPPLSTGTHSSDCGPAPNRDGPLYRAILSKGNLSILEVPRSEFLGCAHYSWKVLFEIGADLTACCVCVGMVFTA